MAKGKFKTLKSLPKKKKKNAFKQNTSPLSWKKPKQKQKGMLVTMPTDVLIVWFATFPMLPKMYETMANAGVFGKELLSFANSLPTSPEGEEQRKFIIFIVFIVASIMKIDELLNDVHVTYMSTEFKELVDTIDTPHFKNTVLYDMEMYMLFISRFLTPAGVLDIDSALEKARKRNEMI